MKELAREIWGDADGVKVKEHTLGRGTHHLERGTGKGAAALRGSRRILPAAQPLRWIHRVDGESEIYFVANPSLRNFNTTASFRVAGKLPELWWPDTGRIEPAPLFQAQDGVTSVSLTFGPNDSVFVVFRKPLTRQSPLLALGPRWQAGAFGDTGTGAAGVD